MEDEKRRSHRIMFSIPVVLRGVDEDCLPFEASGRTIILNQHGARVLAGRQLRPGQIIGLARKSGGGEAEFRVVGPVLPRRNRNYEWGVECLNADENVWKIDFPSPDEDSAAHILLECSHCHTLTLQPLSLDEVKVIEIAGLLTRPCLRCCKSTFWGYPQQVYPAGGMEADPEIAVEDSAANSPSVVHRRRLWRKQAQLPIRVRDYFGQIEVSRTENISRDGFCFSSLRQYLVGQGIVVVCPFNPAVEKPEALACVVRVGPELHSGRNIYGVRYDQRLR